MIWWRDRILVVVVAAFFVGLIADLIFWQPHPFAILAGISLAKLLDPIVLVGGIIIGLAFGWRWTALAAIIVLGVGIELMAANGEGRAMLGRSGWSMNAYMGAVLALCMIAIVVAGARRFIARLKRREMSPE